MSKGSRSSKGSKQTFQIPLTEEQKQAAANAARLKREAAERARAEQLAAEEEKKRLRNEFTAKRKAANNASIDAHGYVLPNTNTSNTPFVRPPFPADLFIDVAKLKKDGKRFDAYHREDICEMTTNQLAFIITKKLEQGKYKQAIDQLTDCIDKRENAFYVTYKRDRDARQAKKDAAVAKLEEELKRKEKRNPQDREYIAAVGAALTADEADADKIDKEHKNVIDALKILRAIMKKVGPKYVKSVQVDGRRMIITLYHKFFGEPSQPASLTDKYTIDFTIAQPYNKDVTNNSILKGISFNQAEMDKVRSDEINKLVQKRRDELKEARRAAEVAEEVNLTEEFGGARKTRKAKKSKKRKTRKY
jgi:hypothetical protein